MKIFPIIMKKKSICLCFIKKCQNFYQKFCAHNDDDITYALQVEKSVDLLDLLQFNFYIYMLHQLNCISYHLLFICDGFYQDTAWNTMKKIHTIFPSMLFLHLLYKTLLRISIKSSLCCQICNYWKKDKWWEICVMAYTIRLAYTIRQKRYIAHWLDRFEIETASLQFCNLVSMELECIIG